jgi:hypothetical protein
MNRDIKQIIGELEDLFFNHKKGLEKLGLLNEDFLNLYYVGFTTSLF